MNDTDQIFTILLKEYDKLKSEQTQRIGFRDNLLYVTLGLFGTVISFVVSNPANYYALLVIPWVCIILGWTYVVNDEKISSIGKYIRHTLVDELKDHVGKQNVSTNMDTIFGWEIAHRADNLRVQRKIQQLFVDEITFVFSGTISLIAFWCLVIKPPLGVAILSWVELSLLIGLGIEIFIYADLKKGR
jgi:ABC-type transport system involved in multi-copper enzyme maturation permease subunit